MNKLKNITNALRQNDKYVFFLSILFLIIFSLPLLLLGEDVPYESWDNLDSNIIWRNLMIVNHSVFADSYATIPQIMNGVPRLTLGTELNLFVMLAGFLPAAESLAINRFLQIMVGFVGMFLLCRTYIIDNRKTLPAVITSILFAILPFWSPGCLSIAMQPLVVFSFLRMRDKKQTIGDWLVMIIYPFVSIFVVYGFFFYIFLFVLFCRDWHKNKKINLILFFALVILSVLSIVTMYREILCLFVDTNFVSHRSEFIQEPLSFKSVISLIKHLLASNGGHANALHFFIILFCFSALVYSIIKTKKWNWNNKIIILFFVICLISIYTIIIQWQPIQSIISSVPFLREFNINRFPTLFPLLSYICLAYGFNVFLTKRYSNLIFGLFFIFQLSYSIKMDFTYYGLLDRYIFKYKSSQILTFREFFDTELFTRIKKHIGKPEDTYRTVCLGLYPSITAYNGLFCLDSYQCLYPLSYKHSFREIIAPELDKNTELKDYFDGWGSRCYLFSSELMTNNLWSKNDKKQVFHLDINTEKLKQLSQKEVYIFSAVEIVNHHELGFTPDGIFEGLYWKIYLYRIKM